MEKIKGPMAKLQTWVTDRTRIKVMIRKNHGVRGHVTGILRLFDKHWNLVMTDVEEQFERRKFRYATELCLESSTEKEARKRLRELGLEHPHKNMEVRVVSKKRVMIKKKHPILLIKGDQVVTIICPPPPKVPPTL